MSLESLYKEVIMAHHQEPFGRLPLLRVDTSAHGHNASCGDDVTVNMQLENGRIAGFQIQGQGCAICTASGSMLAQVAVGMTVEELKGTISDFRNMLTLGKVEVPLKGDLEALSGVSRYPVRVKCASLPGTTALDAMAQLEK